jgi:hypothetical protein
MTTDAASFDHLLQVNDLKVLSVPRTGRVHAVDG